jgi:hypothetical protein
MRSASVGLASLLVVGAACWPREAAAVRFTLGVATLFDPVIVESNRPAGSGFETHLGFQPVIEVEALPELSFGAYFPFTVLRTGEGSTSSSGAESVFGFSASYRYVHLLQGEPILSASGTAQPGAPRELMFYGTLRGGFSTIDGRPGPFVGGAAGTAFTWLDTGRGLFAELTVGHMHVGQGSAAPIERWTGGVSIGVVFRLGGDSWLLGNPAAHGQ